MRLKSVKLVSENTIYTLLALIVPIPFLFINDVSGPIVEREVIFHSYKTTYRNVWVTGYENGSRGTWRLYSGELNTVKSLKPGQVVVIKSEKCNDKGGCGKILSLFDGKNYLIKEEK